MRPPPPRPPSKNLGRRAASSLAIAALSLSTSSLPLLAAENDRDSLFSITTNSRGLVKGDSMPLRFVTRPSYGLESPDVYYPPWFLGRWRATSTLREVLAPAGAELFSPGRNGTALLAKARAEVGDPLAYDVRWRRDGENNVVVDRAYNVESISRASMGAGAVQSTQEDGPDHLVMVLKPSGAAPGALFRADVRVVARRADAPRADGDGFDCAEVVRQTVVAVQGEQAAAAPARRSPLLKEVETICTYDRQPGGTTLVGTQRTATYLVPDATYTADPTLAEQAAAGLASAGGRPVAIDVRHYDLVYEKAV